MSTVQPTPYPIEPEKSWFGRHRLATVLVALCIAALGFVVALVVGVMTLMKSNDAYRQALATAQSSPAVIEALGQPIKAAWWLSGNVNVSGPSGNADLAIPISGPKGRATLYAVATKRAGRWHFRQLEVAVEGRSERMTLVPSGADGPPQEHER